MKSLCHTRSFQQELNSKIHSPHNPSIYLTPVCSNHSEQLWIWNFDGEGLFYDNHETVRFQVVDEEWHDQTPLGPPKGDEVVALPPYKIKGSMAREGLGVCLWWDG
jgi:DNA-directed RNA polymerase subunit E'/Rpb7